MRLAIMQPYFFPYIGYFQLIAAVDLFIIYDNIKYTKKGWINRNRILRNGADEVFSLPIRKGSDHLGVCERELAPEFEREKMLNRLRDAYRKAPQFKVTMPLVEEAIHCQNQNLFDFLYNTLLMTCRYLGVKTEMKKSSLVYIDHGLKGEAKVIAICKATGATTYINSIGGQSLYSTDAFLAHGINLKFIQSKPIVYSQFVGEFVPWLSIIDVMMFNPLDEIQSRLLSHYELV